MAADKKLGDILKEAGLIDEFQLQSALSHQRNWGGKLGSILIELEFVREEDIARVMAEKLHTPHIDLFEPEIPQAVIKTIKADIAKKYHVVPVKKEGGALILAMFDPLDIEAIDAVRFITGLNVKPSLAMGSEIRDAIRKYYDGELVLRKQAQTHFHQPTQTSDKMDIIRGNQPIPPLNSGSDPAPRDLFKEDAAQAAPTDIGARLDALISVLVGKGLITSEELVSIITQKKIRQ